MKLNNDNFNISVFGSCVSRDLLDYGDKNIIRIKSYIARQSIVSAVSKSIECNYDEINLNSEFQKKQVYGDITKDTFHKLSSDTSRYLLLDLIDERFELIEYKDTVLTLSSELAKSNYISEIRKIPRNSNKTWSIQSPLNSRAYTINGDKLSNYIDDFCSRILNIYDCNNIIIHKAKMLDYYKDTTGNIHKFPLSNLTNNKKNNDLLNYMYFYFLKRLPKAKVIDICDEYVADENHKWGLAPMHYEEEYYLKAMEYLMNFLEEIK